MTFIPSAPANVSPVNSSWALQKSIVSTLSASSEVVAALGGLRIYDEVPEHASYPYLTIGQSRAIDWSTGSEEGEEHILTLHVWSQGGGKQEAQNILGTVREALKHSQLDLEDHHLVNIHHEFSDARLDPESRSFHGIVRFRAVTEPRVIH